MPYTISLSAKFCAPSVEFTLSHPPSLSSILYVLSPLLCSSSSAKATSILEMSTPFCTGLLPWGTLQCPGHTISPERLKKAFQHDFILSESQQRERERECSRDWHYVNNSQTASLGGVVTTFTCFTFVHLVDAFFQSDLQVHSFSAFEPIILLLLAQLSSRQAWVQMS